MSRSVLAAALALAAFAPFAPASQGSAQTEALRILHAHTDGNTPPPAPTEGVIRAGELFDTPLTYEVVYDWPDALSRGWYPLSITLTNESEEPLGVRVLAEPRWGGEDRVTQRLTLAPGQTSELELLLRVRGFGQNQYAVTLEAGGEEHTVRDCWPNSPSGGRDVLFVSRSAPEAGSGERWAQEWYTALETGSWSTSYNAQFVSPRSYSQLSSNWQAYTSFDSVILDLSEGAPTDEDLAALLAWCRAGGTLHALGLPADALREVPALAPYLEPRFEFAIHDVEAFGRRGLEAYACGFGRLVVQTGPTPPEGLMDAPEGGVALAFVADRGALAASWTRGVAGSSSRLQEALGLLGKFADLPLRALMVLLIGFALLMGPVNFLYVRRAKKPLLLLATVPGIALVTSLGLLAYGVLSEGLDVKVLTRSWSVVDQRTQQATSAEARNLFAGSSPGEGLRPESGTAVVPDDRFWWGSWSGGNLFTCDYTNGRLLGGTYLPVRRPVGQLVLSDRASRLRLEARRTDDRIEVTNALGANLEEVVLRTPDGEYHYLQEPVPEGEAQLLTWGGASARGVAVTEQLNWFRTELREKGSLMRGTYLARLSEHALRDDLGIEVVEVEGAHFVLGILDGDEGAWR